MAGGTDLASIPKKAWTKVCAAAGIGRPHVWSTERWRSTYAQGSLDYFADLLEYPRYSILVGYIRWRGAGVAVLDLGCGAGLLRQHLGAVAFGTYIGVDPIPEAIEQARPLEDERTRFVLGDPLTTALEPADVVVLNEVIYMVPDPVALVRHAAALVAPGGVLLTSNWRHRGDEAVWRLLDAHLDRLDTVEVRNLGSRIAPRGWRVACCSPRPLAPTD